jgi:hypothetical protein
MPRPPIKPLASLLVCGLLSLIPAPRIQAQTTGEPRDVTRVFKIQYVDLDELKQLLGIFPAQTIASAGALSVKGSKEVVDAIEETIKRLDIPPVPVEERAAELTIFVLTPGDQPGGALPAVLGPVVTQLNAIFSYKGLRLIDTLLVRGAARSDEKPTDKRAASAGNQSTASGTLAVGSADMPASYAFGATFQLRKTDNEPHLYLQGMNFTVSAPRAVEPKAGADVQTGGIRTNLEIRPGQQVVVGKTSIGSDPLILVMTARFLD